jgi:hypothetical protein
MVGANFGSVCDGSSQLGEDLAMEGDAADVRDASCFVGSVEIAATVFTDLNKLGGCTRARSA